MPYPSMFNRKNSKLSKLLNQVESFDYSEGKTLMLEFKSHVKAVYKRGQIYSVWRNKKRDFEPFNIPIASTPNISIKDNVLTFSKKGKNGEDEYKVIKEEENKK